MSNLKSVEKLCGYIRHTERFERFLFSADLAISVYEVDVVVVVKSYQFLINYESHEQTVEFYAPSVFLIFFAATITQQQHQKSHHISSQNLFRINLMRAKKVVITLQL